MVNQLSKAEKIKLIEKLEKGLIDKKLSMLIQMFKTEELDIQTITEEVEKVRKLIEVSQKD